MIDGIIILIPIQFVMMGVLSVSQRQAELFYSFLFAVYGAIATENFSCTIGKYFSKQRIVDYNGGSLPILYLGLRELTKAMYIIPYVGWFAGFISVLMIFIRKDGRGLHDIIGNSEVIYIWQLEKAKESGKDEQA